MNNFMADKQECIRTEYGGYGDEIQKRTFYLETMLSKEHGMQHDLIRVKVVVTHWDEE